MRILMSVPASFCPRKYPVSLIFRKHAGQETRGIERVVGIDAWALGHAPAVLCSCVCSQPLIPDNECTTCDMAVQIYPEGSGELGWDLDKVAEVAGRCDAMPYALRLWREASALLRAAFSEQRSIMTVVFKAEYFRDDDMRRRMELVRTLGPSLPASVTRAFAT